MRPDSENGHIMVSPYETPGNAQKLDKCLAMRRIHAFQILNEQQHTTLVWET